MKKKLLLLLFVFLFKNALFSQNLIVNPGFEIGGSGVGFVTNGAGYSLLTAPYSGTTTTGNFAFTTNPNLINTANFLPSADHTSGNGRMLIIDGNTTAGNPRFWRAGNTGAGITTLTIGTTYRFSYWIKSVSSLVTGPTSQADIGVQITGGTATLVSGSTLAPLPAMGWRHVVYSFTATATTATIELWNNNTSASGNDFAVDDFMLTDDLMVTYNVTDALCATASDGSITVSGLGGTLPYTNYTITGPVTLNNATGVFAGVPPGIYTVSVTDSALPTAATVSMGNVVVGPSLTTSSNVAVCVGSSTTLNVSGSSNPYTWTAAPADASLTTPNVSNPTVTPNNTTVYTVSSTIGACTVTKSVTVTVNPLPVANITGNATICPGNTAVITITGTPSSSVTLTNNLGNTYAPFIPASGTLLWTTPVLNATTVYTLVSVKNFATGCQRNYTGVTVTITVVPNGCATVGTIPGPSSLPLDLTLCTTGECRVIQANISDVPGTSTYAATSIPYCPYPFTDPSYNVVPITGGDDFWSDVINLPFNFCFYGQNYTSCNAGTNGLLTFVPKTPGSFCPWPSTSVPISGQNQSQSIFGVYQDTDMAIPPAAADRQVNWVLQGTYPCRKLIVNFYHLGQWNSTATNPGLQTSQIVLYEVSNIIEVFVQRRVAGAPWAGSGAIGLIGGSAAQWVAAPGRDTGNWTANSEAWRFTPTGPPVPVIINWLQGTTPIGTGANITVCPTATTTYTANAVYNVCGVPQTATTSVTLNVNPDLTNAPVDITQCVNTFDLTTNAGVILGSLNPTDYDISYHLSAADAATVSNPIANPTAFVSSGQTIYVAIYLNSHGCTVVKPFNVIVSCGTISPVPDLSLCESSLGSGTAVFDLTPQTAIALGSEPASDYTFTYYTSQAAANAGIAGTEISPINSFVGTNQTIYIRMEYNANPTIYYTTDFDLIVRSIANAGLDGNTTVCETNTAPINLFSLINGEQAGGVWTRTGGGTGGTFDAATGTFTPAVGATTSTFEYTVTGIAPCVNDTSVATVNIIPQPIAGSDGGIVICASSATPIDLFSLITGEQPGGVWTRTGSGTGGVFSAAAGTFTPTAGATTSTFEYTLAGTSPCVTDFSVATVTISGQPDAGLDGNTTVCETSTTAIDLFSLIIGEQTGGVWTRTGPGTGGTFDATAGTFTPAVGATNSTFTYTLSGVAPCITDTSEATVNIVAQPIAGSDGGIVICASSATPIDLFSLITGEQPGGVWTRTGTGTGGIFSAAAGTFTPTAGATTSTFEYTLAGVSPCVTDFSVATVTISGQPDAGIDGNTTVCETSTAAINLFSLITGEQPGGVWTRTGSGTGGTFDATAGTFTPAVGAITSTFTYTLSGVAPCITDTSEATVNIIAQPTAGLDGNTTVCETNTTAIDLFSLITGEQAGGVWTRTGPGTGGTFNAAAGTFAPAVGATTSTFTYTVTGAAPCTTDSSIAIITINAQPTAGTDGGTTICETSTTVINLFSLITGEQAGGVWTRTGTGTGGTFDALTGTFTPAVGATTSTFTYTVTGAAPCTTDDSIATITINAQPTAGTDGGTVVCETSTTAIDLFSLITGEQPGGVWTRTGAGTGGTFDAIAGTYTPAVGATSSTFTYTVTGAAPCINDSSVATVNINAQPTAGTDGGTTICENSTAVINLFSLITGEQAGGTWTRTGTGTGGTFNAAAGTFTPALGVTTSTFSYTVNGTAPCINDSSEVTITVNPLPTATISGTATVCQNSASPQITFTGSNGTAPYTFTYSINTVVQPSVSTVAGNSISINAPTATSGVYTYALVSVQDGASPSCLQSQSGSAVVTVNTAPTINTPTPYVVCDDSLDNNGFYCFNLVSKDPEISTDPNVVITYHETLTDSQTGANPKPSPYCNLNPGTQTLYVRAHFTGSSACYTNTTLQLVINPIPLPNPVITDYELCDYNNSPDGIEVFNLGTKSAEIANGQTGVTVSYYATLSDAQNQVSPLPNLYSNTSNPQQIWVNIRDNATGCNTTGTFNLIVNPLPVVTVAPTLFECSIGSSPTAEFDLTINQGTVSGGVTGLMVTYYTSLAAAQNGSPSIVNPSAYIGTDNEVVYIRVENVATTCYATTTQLLRVTQGPVANTPLPLHYCDPNNDGFGVFDLDSTIAEITGSTLPIPGVSVTFHETLTDSQTGANPKPSPYYNITVNTQTIYVRVFYTLTGCANYVNLQLIVDPTPEATDPDAYELCDYTGAAGFETFDLTSTISDILGAINPLTHTVTFYTTQLAAESGTGNIINPTSYVSDTQTIYVRVETTATGCYDIVPLQLIVNPLPNTLPFYPQYSLCDTTGAVGFETFDLASQLSSILLGQTGMDVTFYPSLSDAQGDTNVITNLQYTNTQIYVQTLGIRITNQDTDCYVISTMDIRVEPLPTLIPLTAPYTLCDDNQDGFSCDFDLLSLEADMLGGASGSANYILSFYETLTDAQTGNTVTDIDPTQPYCNINPFVQLLYVRAEDPTTHCYSVLVIELNVSPSPIAPVNLDPITVCDQDSIPQNASTVVDLTQQTAAILAQQTGAASDYTVEYYTTQLLAEQGTLPIINDTNYGVSDGDTIWVRVEHKTTNCYNIGSFEIEINTPLLLTTPTPLNMCDDDAAPNNQFHVFDLTIKNNEINQGTGFAVTYYPSLPDARNGTNVITTPTAYQNVPSHPGVQTLGVVVTTASGCTSITTLDIRVLPIPTPNTTPTPLAPKCDDNNPGDMLEVFDLTVNEGYIGNGDPNLSFHYFATQNDAIANVGEIVPATAALVGGNVWIRVENNGVDYQNNNCYVLVEQPLTVNPLPIVVQPQAPYRACDNNTDGISVFDLTNPDLAEAILGATQLPADFTISYHLTQAAATAGSPSLPNSYTNVTPNAQDIYIRVVNIATGCVNTGILPLAVEAYATATGPQEFNECDNNGNPYDGVALIDLTSYAPAILGTQDPAVFLVSYYTSLADAQAGTNALTLAQAQAYQTDADIDTIWVKVENSSNLITPLCYAITTIDIKVERYPNPIIGTVNDITTICVDYITNQVVRPLTLNSGVVNPGNYTFEWFEGTSTTPIPGATGPTYTVDTAEATGATREYTVRVTSATPQGCQTTSSSFSVIQSGQAVVAAGTVGYTVTGAFSSTQIITVTVEGYGAPDYQYSLDDGPRQDSNVFEGVSMGTHVIHVWDAKGNIAYSCEELVINEVYIIDYPHYFTPNGDGIHDTWNVVGLDEAKIFIFDRYGKLLKQISPTGAGWDGTYNGHLLPSDDYWFTVDFAEGGVMKQFKSHFAMKR